MSEKTEGKKSSLAKDIPFRIRDEIDGLLVRQASSEEIRKLLILKVPGLPPFSEASLEKYLDGRRKFLDQNEEVKKSLEFINREVNLLKIDTANAPAVLDGILNQSIERVEVLKKQNENVGDVGRERVIAEHLKIINSAINTQLTMEAHGYYMEERLREASQVIFRSMYEGFIEIYKKMHGSAKFSEFSQACAQLQDHMDWETINQEVSQKLLPEK